MFSLRLEGDIRRLRQKLGAIGDIDKRGVNLALAEGIRTSTDERFYEEKTPDGEKWKRSIRSIETGGKTLTDGSRLRRSIKAYADENKAGVGTNLVYARTQQLGDKNRLIKAKTTKGLRFQVGGQYRNVKSVRVTIPARTYLGINEKDMETIKVMLENAVIKS